MRKTITRERLCAIALLMVLGGLTACSSSPYRMRIEIDSATPATIAVSGDNPEVHITNEGPGKIQATFLGPDPMTSDLGVGKDVARKSPGPIEVRLSTTSPERSWVKIEGRDATGISSMRVPAAR